MLHFVYIFLTNISTEYFKHAAHSPFFSSKCRLFQNATFFFFFVIHILRTECSTMLFLNSDASRLMVWILSEQSKLYTLTILDVLNVTGADIMLVTFAY
jgi:hypothetical protein